jgi:Thioredoxin
MNLLQKLSSTMSYAEYLALIDQLHLENKVTGAQQSDDLLAYSLHNKKRMDRLDKTFRPDTDTLAMLQQVISSPMIWITITEGWCGDASQIVPILESVSKELPMVEHRIMLRDDNLDVMDQFLTNGGRAVPKIIFLEAQSGQVLGSWGPRPAAAQEVMNDYKKSIAGLEMTEAETKERFEQAKLAIHSWYAHNKGADVQNELLVAIEAAVQHQLQSV